MVTSIQLDTGDEAVEEVTAPDNMEAEQTSTGGYKVTQTEGEPNPADSEAVRPAKFKSDADWRKAYDELEKKFTQTNQDTNSLTVETDSSDEGDTEEGGDETSTVEADFSNYENEFATEGKLSDKSYEELEAKGYPRRYVDGFIQGQQLIQQQARSELLSIVGGEESFTSMATWAKANYDSAQAKAYNEAINSGDSARAKLAMKALKSDYESSKGTGTGNLLKGGKSHSSAEQGYRSQAEVTEAMRDPRYDRDPAYRNDVIKKLQATQFGKQGTM